ncbi:molybdopterin-dependent oxidoreductase [Halomonas urumqiensis]|uniref:molybdopterin-dependent oxidoreductase n=1 Tax=Halomonas urumqiensis TaxID=1684789 RepID=UPI0015E0BA03|nr:molybdopterin-dependent oxidoreductase [Halomonas urumqiensis]
MLSVIARADPLAEPQESPLLRISGNIERTNVGDEAHFDRAMLERLPRRTLATSTVVTDGINHFEGFMLRDLLEWVGADGQRAIASALNDYEIDIPMADFHTFDVLLADTMDGDRLTVRDKGPLWIVYPRDDHAKLQDIRYDYRWVWQLNHLEIQ